MAAHHYRPPAPRPTYDTDPEQAELLRADAEQTEHDNQERATMNTNQYFVIEPDGTMCFVDTTGYTTLKALQKIVGGYIERADSQRSPEIDIYVNEEGLIIGLEYNLFSTIVGRTPLAGPIVLAGSARDDIAPPNRATVKDMVRGAVICPTHTVDQLIAARAAGNYWHPAEMLDSEASS